MEIRNSASTDVRSIVERIQALEAVNAGEVMEAALEGVADFNTFVGSDPDDLERARFSVSVAGHDIVLHGIGFTLGAWSDRIQYERSDWIDCPRQEAYPLRSDTVADIEAISAAVDADDDVAPLDRHAEIWRRLAFNSKVDIVAAVSKAVWMDRKDAIKACLTERLEDWIEDEVYQLERQLRQVEDREVVLISRQAMVVFMQGKDLDDAERRLYAQGRIHGDITHEMLVQVDAWSRRNGSHDFDAYSVPAGIDFEVHDVKHVERWGHREGSYVSEVVGVDKAA